MNRVCVMSTWDVMNETNLHDIVVCRSESQSFESGPLPGRSVCLKRRAGVQTSCGLKVAMRADEPGASITATDVLCNARCLEVFSECDEYICTERGLHIEDKVDSSLYLLQHTFEPPVRNCHLQFVRLATPDEMWVYSIHVTLTDSPPTPCGSLGILGQPQKKVDIDHVRSRLAESDAPIPDVADRLMKAVENFQQNQFGSSSEANAATPNMAAMMAMLVSMGRPLVATSNNTTTRNESHQNNQLTRKNVEKADAHATHMEISEQCVVSKNDNTVVRSSLAVAARNKVVPAASDLSHSPAVCVENRLRVMTTTDDMTSVSETATDFAAQNVSSVALDCASTAVSDGRIAAKMASNDADSAKNLVTKNVQTDTLSDSNDMSRQCNGAALLTALETVQRNVKSYIRESESRIVSEFGRRLRETECRLDSKLDFILQLSSTAANAEKLKDYGGNTSNSHIELD